MKKTDVTPRTILKFWLPLAATWLMMSVEGPFLAAVIARMADPKYNLAAYGVAFSFALIVEAPVIMIMSAATALVRERLSHIRLRNFTVALNIGITGAMLFGLIPPVFRFIAMDLINLPESVARLTYGASILLLPWPAAIGFRRYYQGLLIAHNRTRLVAYGTVVRLASMAGSAMALHATGRLPGAWTGAAALSVGVISEAIASRWMAAPIVGTLMENNAVPAHPERLTYRAISRFYWPLALTSILSLGVQPLVTFFMGHARFAVESLAVLPVVNSLVFIFRSMGLSFQEVAIALMGDRWEGYRPLRRFALTLAAAVSICLGLVAFTPLSDLWFHVVSGLSTELTSFALTPTRILVLMPALSVIISWQRAVLVHGNRTAPISTATGIEVLGILLVLWATTVHLGWVGATAAALGFVVGRLSANAWLVRPLIQTRRNTQPRTS